MKCEDVVVVWGGANDITGNKVQEALKYMSKFVNENKGVNIVLINSPQRHDQTLLLCVNKKVVKFNRQVKKIMKIHSNVQLLEIVLILCFRAS